MPLDDFKGLCDYLKENKIFKLKIMGGEPTVHEHFEELIEYSQMNFEQVHIFTNGQNEKLRNIKLRDKDSIVYNFQFIDEHFDMDKFLPNKEGSRLLEIQISSDCDIDETKKRLKRVYDAVSKDKVRMNLTLNCMENIFENKEAIVEKWNAIHDFIEKELETHYNIDHNIPYCFFVNSKMKIKMGSSICKLQCAGLIDASLNLRYCNQFSNQLINIKKNGKFIPFKIVENYIYKAYMEKLSTNLNKLCKSCIFFNTQCNGGCFMHKDIINFQSIIKSTGLPTRKNA